MIEHDGLVAVAPNGERPVLVLGGADAEPLRQATTPCPLLARRFVLGPGDDVREALVGLEGTRVVDLGTGKNWEEAH